MPASIMLAPVPSESRQLAGTVSAKEYGNLSLHEQWVKSDGNRCLLP